MVDVREAEAGGHCYRVVDTGADQEVVQEVLVHRGGGRLIAESGKGRKAVLDGDVVEFLPEHSSARGPLSGVSRWLQAGWQSPGPGLRHPVLPRAPRPAARELGEHARDGADARGDLCGAGDRESRGETTTN